MITTKFDVEKFNGEMSSIYGWLRCELCWFTKVWKKP